MVSYFFGNVLLSDSKTKEVFAMEVVDTEGNYYIILRIKEPKIVELEEFLGEK
jgi:hypothetical protein